MDNPQDYRVPISSVSRPAKESNMSTAYRHPLPDAATRPDSARSEEMIRCCAAGGPPRSTSGSTSSIANGTSIAFWPPPPAGPCWGACCWVRSRHASGTCCRSLAGGFLLQHALQGACPPLDMLRHLGVRYQSEIDEERRWLHDHLNQYASAAGAGGHSGHASHWPADGRRLSSKRPPAGSSRPAKGDGRHHGCATASAIGT